VLFVGDKFIYALLGSKGLLDIDPLKKALTTDKPVEIRVVNSIEIKDKKVK
jgi:hypothetical protein